MTIKRHFWFIFLVTIIFLIITLNYCYKKNILDRAHDQRINSAGDLKKTGDSVVISKQAVDDLVKKAAQQKYIQDVFSDNKKLPLPNSQNIQLQPYQSNSDLKPNINQTQNIAPNSVSMRCSYNGQSYVAGDIVKTDQAWIRCTPTFYFSPDKPMVRQVSQPAWALVQ